MEPKDIMILGWLISHPLVYFGGKWWVRAGFLGEKGPKLQVPFQVASWVFGLYFVTLFLWPSKPVWLDHQIFRWIWFASGPLCCFLAGFSFTMERKSERLLPIIYVVIVTVIMAFIYGILFLLRPVFLGPPY